MASAPGPAPDPQRVNIILTKSDDQDSIIVAPGKFHIKKGGQVEWYCSSAFSIDFVGTGPFGTPHYSCPGGSKLSGAAITAGPDFKYRVTIGGNVLDPSGKVDP